MFGLAAQPDGSPIAIIGVTAAAADYMSDGKTHTFDLTSLGFPVKIMLFGAPTHRAALDMIGQGSEEAGLPIQDLRDADSSIKPPRS
ncbi:hypothetical protein [Sphingomonas sp. TREG-RG-20F-R18-01]|uniref:hypothetical protein n=1 Tax=Sphingomonas sp. TREG-RG-20F-R18-01 TaxID=2914982 RepID=UPI001F5ADC84|nr:hypothetical protein [Sphingomonas sp. TREG-RG-20F-R18-01]